MKDTPRLRSAFPSTPVTDQKPQKQDVSASGSWSPLRPLPDLLPCDSEEAGPIIPFSVIDAPSQRLYIAFFYLGLTVWRLADYSKLVSDETDSLWLFMKWVAIDSVFLYALPGLKVPWLQWSSSTTSMLFILHALLNAGLMFRIPIPLESWLLALTKLFYDRELAITEIRVKPASILQNSSLILGKQIIHILPEGSAMLNPDQKPFCIDGLNNIVHLPIRVNQSNPILIELLRSDLATNINETISIGSKQLKKLKKQAEKAFAKNDRSSPRVLEFPVKQSGVYRLQKVIDESKLEVPRGLSDTVVVQCPSATVKAAPQNKCKGELSDFYLEVEATPPFKIKYRKILNGEDNGHVLLSIHPDNLVSPLNRPDAPGILASREMAISNVSWARSQSLRVPLNESLGVGGYWQYHIDEVHDAFGNIVDYSGFHHEDLPSHKSKRENPRQQIFSVQERPKISLDGCSSQHSLKVPKEHSRLLPILLSSTGANTLQHSKHIVTYLFTPEDSLLPNQEHSEDAKLEEVEIVGDDRGFLVRKPGLYTLKSVSAKNCDGEVLEPSSCLVQTPPQPSLTITTANIPDQCAGNSIGLVIDLDLTGTPPIRLSYEIHHADIVTTKIVDADRLQKQLELRPPHAGKYTYKFVHISDAVYKDPRILNEKSISQDVKPSASAKFRTGRQMKIACLGEDISFDLDVSGEPPLILLYEIVQNGKRDKTKKDVVYDPVHTIKTHKFTSGGDYSLVLKSITDKSGCTVLLDEEVKIEVSLQMPKASFGQLDGKRSISALEGKKIILPLRLQGEPPWAVTYRNLEQLEFSPKEQVIYSDNGQLEVSSQGTYEIVGVRDANCPGSVDIFGGNFDVRWIPRPAISVVESSLITSNKGKYVKKSVCEGDEDMTEIFFTGTAPFTVEYTQKFKSSHGSISKKSQKLTAGLNLASFKMEASEAGLNEYEFSKLGDSSYSHDSPVSTLLTVQQQVHSKPSAGFTDVGKTYKYCKEEETGDEVIPITFTGSPPYYLEIEIRHHATSKPEIITIPNIDATHYNFHVPHRVLALGTHAVTVRKVRDAHGCQKKMDFDAPHVQVSVADIPSISALETRTDFCVGDRISFMLTGSPPFHVYYTFQTLERKAFVSTTSFKRIAEKPGEFQITAISDQKSTNNCRARTEITKFIHELPSVRISKGRTATVDIHEGGEVEILFEFGGTPPFEFIYTRSTNPPKGRKPEILETISEISYEQVKTIRASDEGIYEVVSIKDNFCAFSTQKAQVKAGRRLLTYR